MKIEINYDLLDKIREANTGLSLNKTAKFILLRTSIQTTICMIIDMIYYAKIQNLLKDLTFSFLIQGVMTITTDLILSKINKSIASYDLKHLLNLLKVINIDTTYELLLDAYKYKTDYKVRFNNDKIPVLEEKKYIMVPVYENGDCKEVSIVQEHIVGTRKYHLSYGKPNKVLKLVFNRG